MVTVIRQPFGGIAIAHVALKGHDVKAQGAALGLLAKKR
jgi:hypothetical protein